MSVRAKWFPGVCAIVMASSLSACGQAGTGTADSARVSAAASGTALAPNSLNITSWGPGRTKAGVAFNVQPDGSAAVWLHVNRSLEGYEAAIDFNDMLLKGNVSGDLVTATVPASLYAQPGIYSVAVIVRKGIESSRSNSVKFTVE